jgi:hypothetical protein
MKLLKLGTVGLSFCLVLVLFQSALAQTRTEFAGNGKLLRISNLLGSSKTVYGAEQCGNGQFFAGTITEVINIDSDIRSGFEFTLKLARGKRQKLKAGKDIDNLLKRGNRVSVKAFYCGDNGYLVGEIKRL